MISQELPLISLILLSLLGGVGLIWISRKDGLARSFALGASAVALGLSLLLLLGFDRCSAEFQFIDKSTWIPTLNIQYLVGIDGLSVLFLPLTSLIFIAIILASWKRIHSLPRLYYSLLLLLQLATLGVFTALDTILFILFWEMTLIPIYFLIALWGTGPNRRYAAMKYTLLMMIGGVPLLFAFVLLALGDPGGGLEFNHLHLLAHILPPDQQLLIFFLLLFGFAFKTPLFPLHTWLPVVAMEGPIAIGVIMTGFKLGAYGLVRFAIPLAPDAAVQLDWLLAALGAIGMVYGALMAMQQTNLRSMLAYASISHIGLAVLAIASLDIQGIQGAIFQLLNFTVISGGLFLIAGFLHSRTDTTEIMSLGGVANTMPLMASFFFLFGMASIGIPGTSGFPAEFMMLLSTLKNHTGAGIAALLTVVLGAGYFLTVFRRIFFGPVNHEVVRQSKDLQKRELLIVMTLSGLILLVGFYPPLLMDIIDASTIHWIEHLK